MDRGFWDEAEHSRLPRLHNLANHVTAKRVHKMLVGAILTATIGGGGALLYSTNVAANESHDAFIRKMNAMSAACKEEASFMEHNGVEEEQILINASACQQRIETMAGAPSTTER